MQSILEYAEYTGVCWVYWSMLSILTSKLDLVLG